MEDYLYTKIEFIERDIKQKLMTLTEHEGMRSYLMGQITILCELKTQRTLEDIKRVQDLK